MSRARSWGLRSGSLILRVRQAVALHAVIRSGSWITDYRASAFSAHLQRLDASIGDAQLANWEAAAGPVGLGPPLGAKGGFPARLEWVTALSRTSPGWDVTVFAPMSSRTR